MYAYAHRRSDDDEDDDGNDNNDDAQGLQAKLFLVFCTTKGEKERRKKSENSSSSFFFLLCYYTYRTEEKGRIEKAKISTNACMRVSTCMRMSVSFGVCDRVYEFTILQLAHGIYDIDILFLDEAEGAHQGRGVAEGDDCCLLGIDHNNGLCLFTSLAVALFHLD